MTPSVPGLPTTHTVSSVSSATHSQNLDSYSLSLFIPFSICLSLTCARICIVGTRSIQRQQQQQQWQQLCLCAPTANEGCCRCCDHLFAPLATMAHSLTKAAVQNTPENTVHQVGKKPGSSREALSWSILLCLLQP